MGDIINAGADLLGFGPASKQADATRAAANISAETARQATQLQREMFQQQQQNQAPWLAAGQTALNALIPMATNYQPFGMSQFQQDPGYQFRLSEGQRAMAHGATPGRGGLVSGNTLKAMQDYAQNSASGEYQNAFNRYQTERNARLNPLQSLAGVGQTAVNQLGTAGQNYATNAGNIGMTGGANQANAMLTQGNINASQYNTLGKGIDQLYNYGSKNNWWDSSGGSSPGTNMTQEQYALVSGF
jgi:hypothetical protein